MDGMILCDKPEGASSHDEVLRVRRALSGAKTGHAGTLDPFATGLLLVLVGRATRIARYILTLPKTYVTTARYGALSSTGDPDGEIVETGRVPPDPPPLPTGEVPPAPAGVLGDPRSPACAPTSARGAARRSRCPSDSSTSIASSSCGARTASAAATRSSAAAARTSARSSPSWAMPTASRCAARASAPGASTQPTARRSSRSGTCSPRSCRSSTIEGEQARRARHGALVDVESDGTVVLADGEGPICIAEPREGGGVKASVGFRA